MAANPRSPDEDQHRLGYVDLTLGAWRAREAAGQLAAGLGIVLPPLDRGEFAPMSTGRHAIDAAARGDPVILAAHDDAVRIAAAFPAGTTVAVLAPAFGLPLRTENEWFFLFLRRHGVSVAIVGDEPAGSVGRSLFERRRGVTAPEPPGGAPTLADEQRRLLRLFPGLLPRALADRLGIAAGACGLVAIGASHFLIPPAFRDTRPKTAPREFDALEAFESLDDGLLGLSQTFCTGYFADAAGLVGLGRRQFLAGSPDLGAALAERARIVARDPGDAAAADLLRQEIRLFEGRFAEIGAMQMPSARTPDSVRRSLEQVKLRGAVAAGQFTGIAEIDRLRGRLTASGIVDPDVLHLLAVAAEAGTAGGDGVLAAELAEGIDAALRRDPDADQRLVFSSALSLARAARLRGDAAEHRAGLERAFATSAGARSLAEVLEMNALLAATHPVDSTPARLCWLRAALAWLAIEPAEGLSAGAARAIRGDSDVPRAQFDVDISEAIAAALDAAWPRLRPTHGDRLPLIRRFAGDGPSPAKLYGGPGAAVLWTRDAHTMPVYARPRLRLIRLAHAALAELCPPLGIQFEGSLLVDANLGDDVPASRGEALSVALRAGVEEFIFAGESLVLDETLRPRFADDLVARLSPIVARIETEGDRTRVAFRRHLPEATVDGDRSRVVRLLRDGEALPLRVAAERLESTVTEAEALVRALEPLAIARLEIVA